MQSASVSSVFTSDMLFIHAHFFQDLSRTYAQAVAGLTKFMAYDPNTHLFQVQYIVSSECISDITEVGHRKCIGKN